jgi:hypothetical protein
VLTDMVSRASSLSFRVSARILPSRRVVNHSAAHESGELIR